MPEQLDYKAADTRYDGRMPYFRCGRSGVKLSAVSLGFWHNFGSVDDFDKAHAIDSGVKLSAVSLGFWHNFGSVDDFDKAHAIAKCAFDNGITCFDLANNYGPEYGTAEENLGRMMDLSFRPYRDELFITTKAGYDMWPGPYGDWGSRKYLISSLDQSLKRMRLDYVDLFYSHRYDPETPLEETMQTLVDIVRQGKALYVGISNYPVDTLDFCFNYLKQRDVPCLIYQGRFNMMDRRAQESGILDKCYEAGVGFTAFSPLNQGLLSDRYLRGIPADSRMARNHFLKREVLTMDLVSRLQRLNDIAASRSQTLSEMALAWLLKDSMVTSVLVGASSPEQILTDIKAVNNTEFTADELYEIDKLSRKT